VDWAVRFEEVSKQYRGGTSRYASLREDVTGAFRRLFGRRPAEPLRRPATLALDRVSFEVAEGESFAIIGPNGAGKTTALKIIARISYPTGGRVRARGRVGALIEVGSGVHPELSGRENIWLYGQILGMSRAEIRERFEEIVEFAELGRVLETPVKMYSSGMQLRLGFAIASHLDPEIFVVDEALAVGDAGFQAKCVERMTRLVREGRTLLFVSHTLPLVREVCTRGILLDAGQIAVAGTPEEVIDSYLRRVGLTMRARTPTGEAIEVASVRARSGREGAMRLATFDPIVIEIDLEVSERIPDAILGVGITDGRPGNLISMSMLSEGRSVSLTSGRHTLRCSAAAVPLLPSAYEIWFSAYSSERAVYYAQPRIVGTLVISDGPDNRRKDLLVARTGGFGPVCVPYEIEVVQAGEPAEPREPLG
jgi:ABC-type polysaccharide/polyol phosphate transport system ATPase subunit